MHWLPFPHPHCQVCGLPWFSETAPHLWRFPERMKTELPEGLFEAGKQTAGMAPRLAEILGLGGCETDQPLRTRRYTKNFACLSDLSGFSQGGRSDAR